MKLKTLEDHNRERRDSYKAGVSDAQPLGIACPKCGAELVNPTPQVEFPTYPPQIRIACPKCGHQGAALK